MKKTSPTKKPIHIQDVAKIRVYYADHSDHYDGAALAGFVGGNYQIDLRDGTVVILYEQSIKQIVNAYRKKLTKTKKSA